MTREQAINVLRVINVYDDFPTQEAKKMGIEALSQGFFGDVIKPAIGCWQRVFDSQGISFRCTVCNYKRRLEDSEYKYCPICGAKIMEMRS